MRAVAIRIVLVMVVTALTSGPPARAQDRAEVHDRSETLWLESRALFPVRVLVPETYDPDRAYPAVIALHGFGSSAVSFERYVRPFVEAGYLVVLPQGPYYAVPLNQPGEAWSWGRNSWTPTPLTDDPAVDQDTLQLTIDEYIPDTIARVREDYSLSQVYLFGFSQGGIYAILEGFYRRDLFDGIIAFAAAGVERSWFAQRGGVMEDGSETPILLVGGNEDPYMPLSELERARDLFVEAGYDVELHVFEGGHRVPLAEVERAVEWLKERATPR